MKIIELENSTDAKKVLYLMDKNSSELISSDLLIQILRVIFNCHHFRPITGDINSYIKETLF